MTPRIHNILKRTLDEIQFIPQQGSRGDILID